MSSRGAGGLRDRETSTIPLWGLRKTGRRGAGDEANTKDLAVRDARPAEHLPDQVKMSRFDLPIDEGAWRYFPGHSGKRGIRHPLSFASFRWRDSAVRPSRQMIHGLPSSRRRVSPCPASGPGSPTPLRWLRLSALNPFRPTRSRTFAGKRHPADCFWLRDNKDAPA